MLVNFFTSICLKNEINGSFWEKIPSSCDFTVIGYTTKCGKGNCWIEQNAALNSMYKQFECTAVTQLHFFCNGKTGQKMKAKVYS